MTTSGSYSYNQTALQICTEALDLCTSLSPGETPSSDDIQTCMNSLNMMLKFSAANETGLWANKEMALFMQKNQYLYSLGPSGDHATLSWVRTTLGSASLSGHSLIDVSSATGIADGYYIGIQLDDGTLQWTTVDGAPTGTAVGIDDALTDDASEGNVVYCYQTKTQRPLEIIEARLRYQDSYERPLIITSRQEYMALADKTSNGIANQIFFDPQLTNAKLYVWQSCGDVTDYIKMTVKIPLEDLLTNANNVDFPQEWLLPLSWNLALLIAPKFGKTLPPDFQMMARGMLESVAGWDREYASVYFGLGDRRNRH